MHILADSQVEVEVEIAHFSLELFADIESFPELVVACIKFEIVVLVRHYFFIEFAFFTAEYFAYFFADDHQRSESILDDRGNFSKDRIGKWLGFFGEDFLE